jgi:hypothetical protein
MLKRLYLMYRGGSQISRWDFSHGAPLVRGPLRQSRASTMTCFFVGQHFSKKNFEVLEKKFSPKFGEPIYPCLYVQGSCDYKSHFVRDSAEIRKYNNTCWIRRLIYLAREGCVFCKKDSQSSTNCITLDVLSCR